MPYFLFFIAIKAIIDESNITNIELFSKNKVDPKLPSLIYFNLSLLETVKIY